MTNISIVRLTSSSGSYQTKVFSNREKMSNTSWIQKLVLHPKNRNNIIQQDSITNYILIIVKKNNNSQELSSE